MEANNKLVRIRREINKDTELMPLVRWQFRGLAEEDRKAFLFEKVTDANNKRYDIPVLVASHTTSREVYALALKCQPEGPRGKLDEAVKDLIDVLLTKPPGILKIGKFIIRKWVEADLYTGLGFETIAGTLNPTASAMKDGTTSFSTKTSLWKSRRKSTTINTPGK